MSKNVRFALYWVGALLVGAVLSTRFPLWAMPSAFRRIYQSGILHIGGHLFIYGVLAALIAGQLWRHTSAGLLNWRAGVTLAAVLLVGVLQELAQMAARGLGAFRVNEFFDLGVDLAGGLAGLIAFYLARRRTAQQECD